MARRILRVLLGVAVVAVVATAPAGATFAGSNGVIVFKRSTHLYVVDPSGGAPARITRGAGSDVSPTFAPDSGRIAFARYLADVDRQFVYIVEADGTSLDRVTTSGRGYASAPAWSPDGRRLVFEDLVMGPEGPRGGALFVVRPSGRGLEQLTGYRPRSWDPTWSPDGTRVAFASSGIVVADVTTGEQVRVTEGAVFEEGISWSPDGSLLVFVRTIPGDPPEEGDLGSAIHAIAPDGTDDVQLTDGHPFDITPRWSPDGTAIAFLAMDPYAGIVDLWVMDADGGNQRALTTDGITGYGFAWSPDSTEIAFEHDGDVAVATVATAATRALTDTPHVVEYVGDWQAVPEG